MPNKLLLSRGDNNVQKTITHGNIFLVFFASLSFAQDEQVTVIGSLIKGTPIDSGSPISTFSAEEIESAQG